MIRLAQLSDCHLFADKQATKFGISPYSGLAECLAQALGHQPHGVLVTGDISADDTPESYAHFLHMMNQQDKELEWRIIAGNHDNNPYFEQVLSHKCINANTPWQLGELSVFGLDTRYKGSCGKIKQSEVERIYKQVNDAHSKPCLLAMHHPPFALDNWMKAHECLNYPSLAPYLDQMPKVKAVIHGHLHADTERVISERPIWGVPSTCWQFTLDEAFSLDSQSPGYRIIELDNRGELSSRVYRLATREQK